MRAETLARLKSMKIMGWILLGSLLILVDAKADCEEFYNPANDDYVEAQKIWKANSEKAALYSTRGTEVFVQYLECQRRVADDIIMRKLNQIEKKIEELESKQKPKEDTFGTGY